jgi:hypothetical protein
VEVKNPDYDYDFWMYYLNDVGMVAFYFCDGDLIKIDIEKI